MELFHGIAREHHGPLLRALVDIECSTGGVNWQKGELETLMMEKKRKMPDDVPIKRFIHNLRYATPAGMKEKVELAVLAASLTPDASETKEELADLRRDLGTNTAFLRDLISATKCMATNLNRLVTCMDKVADFAVRELASESGATSRPIKRKRKRA